MENKLLYNPDYANKHKLTAMFVNLTSGYYNKRLLLLWPLGGLLICLPRDKAQSYCEELQSIDGQPAWIVGEVVPGNRQARMDTDLKIIEV